MNQSQIERAKELRVPQHQIDSWVRGELIQRAMPQLCAEDREYIITGLSSEEWDRLFSEEDTW
jgi:hypothetical protein